MKIVFSRKGFDSAAGGGPSPIVDGRPVTLPIPANGGPSRTTYGDLGLADHAAQASRGKLGAKDHCHHDPMFLPDGRAILGQCSGAQTHLASHAVGPGDVFLFFGLFKAEGGQRHHRIFGYLQVERALSLPDASQDDLAALQSLGFPHALGLIAKNDCAYIGKGRMAGGAHDALRLTVEEGPTSLWRIPPWLHETGLSWNPNPANWAVPGRLRVASRGQEFVADIGGRADAHEWLAEVIALIEA